MLLDHHLSKEIRLTKYIKIVILDSKRPPFRITHQNCESMLSASNGTQNPQKKKTKHHQLLFNEKERSGPEDCCSG